MPISLGSWPTRMLMDRPMTKPVTTGLDRKPAMKPSRAMPAATRMTPDDERQRGRQLQIQPRVAAGEWRHHRRRHHRHGRAGGHLQVAAAAEQGIGGQRGHRGDETDLRGHAGQLGVGHGHRDHDAPRRDARHQVAREPVAVVARQPADDGHVANDASSQAVARCWEQRRARASVAVTSAMLLDRWDVRGGRSRRRAHRHARAARRAPDVRGALARRDSEATPQTGGSSPSSRTMARRSRSAPCTSPSPIMRAERRTPLTVSAGPRMISLSDPASSRTATMVASPSTASASSVTSRPALSPASCSRLSEARSSAFKRLPAARPAARPRAAALRGP